MCRENTLENIATLQDKREAIIEHSFWEYIQHKQGLYKTRKNPGKQSLFSGVLRCGAAGAIFTLLNITTAPIMWAIEALALIPTIFVWIHWAIGLDELQRLLKVARSNGFWDRITVAKSIESQETIQELMEQQRIMDKRQNELKNVWLLLMRTR